jgi:acyl-CoA reductase-like NAD-dependent aldehyde dehydrogenase
MQEEIFAPVVGVMRVKSAEEAVEMANDSRYGLCASVWTMDYRKGMLLVDQLKVGTAWINQHLAIVSETPWGGQKESGWTKGKLRACAGRITFQKHIWINLARRQIRSGPTAFR